MGALDAFLDTLPDTFDLTTLLDTEVETIESTIYSKPIIYKYYPSARRSFFSRPQFRFSPREALNDPFEMSRRWREVRAEGLRRYVNDRLSVTLPAAFTNTDLLILMLAEDSLEKGHTFTTTQRKQVESILQSSAGQSLIRSQLNATQHMLPVIVETVFSRIETEFDQLTERAVSACGVLSLTEDPMNNQMWAHYGNQGNGFVVGLKAQHPFFINVRGSVETSLLKKVIYTDQHIENFWTNPYYLFLVKASGWAYEKEWRIIKKFADSDLSVLNLNPPVHLWNVPLDAIDTIHFGYNYDPNEMPTDVANLRTTGANPKFYRIEVNRAMGILEELIVA